ncbi:MAG TPA: hypothetical protein VMK12_17750 [Anaeromyxobacteraceae bacterium]|nr:hypothetical protein [Anaeromyxobacteraceae bacterium]
MTDSDGRAASMEKTTSKRCRPYGDAASADVWFLGHDPRLRTSDAKADTCFFLNLLEREGTHSGGEKAKRRLAQALLDYVAELAGGPVEPSRLYVTNLCNTFLPRPKKGVVLIPDTVAEAGAREIERALANRTVPPTVIIASSQQVLYHLARLGYVEGVIGDFVSGSQPNEPAAHAGAYIASKREAFVDVCGKALRWNNVPLVPVLHISSYRRINAKYHRPMQRAREAVRSALGARPAK